MKHLKKIVSLLLTAVMVLAMCIPVMADAATTYSITIDNAAEDHTYEAYQIFAGELSTDGLSLSNIVWGSGVSEDGKNYFKDAKTKAETLKSEAEAKAFAKEVSKYLTTPAGEANIVTNGKYVINNLTSGYYLIKDKDNSLNGKNDTYTSYILKVVQNVSVKPKSEKPSSYKKVKDINDSTSAETGWQDSADYDIGDKVPFQLTGIVAGDYASYKAYKFVFHDKQSNGLTFNSGSVKVFVDEIEVDKNAYRVVTSTDDGDTFDIIFDNLKNISAVQPNSMITVEYDATLNKKAIIGEAGNPNEMQLEYSNNPNDDQGGETGKTPVDKVIVFTYKTVVNKTNPDNIPLAGAEFKLEKFVKDAAASDEYKGVKGRWEEKSTTDPITSETTSFEFKGLDDGIYRLTETKHPTDYNAIEPIYFEISATHDSNSDDPKLTDLNGNKLEGEISFTKNISDGSLTTSVVNYKGSELPSTGGIGTTIFYVVGVILMLGAGVLLVTKKRMSSNR